MLNRIKIGTKLQVGFLIVSAIASINAIQAVFNFASLEKSSRYLYEKCTLPLAEIGSIASRFELTRVSMRDMLQAADPATIRTCIDNMRECRELLVKATEDYKGTLSGEADKGNYKTFCRTNADYFALLDAVEALAGQRKTGEAWKIVHTRGPQIVKNEQDAIAAVTDEVLENSKRSAENNAKEAHTATVMMIIILIAGSGIGIAIGIFLTRSIAGPLSKCVAMMRELGRGHLRNRLHVGDRQDEIGIMANAMDRFADDLQKNVVTTIQKIGDGELTVDIAAMDDKDEIAPALEKTAASLKGLIEEMESMSRKHDRGETDASIDAGKFHGAYREMAEGVNAMVAGHLAVNRKAMACVAEFGKGNFETALEKFPGNLAHINETVEQVRNNLKALITDTRMLTGVAAEGRLSVRADASKHEGDFRTIIQGFNDTLDAVIGPLNIAAEYVDRISRGEIPEKITENYNGDFNTIKNNLNRCIEALSGLLEARAEMSKLHDRGKIDAVMPVDKFQGAYAEMAEGINSLVQSHIAVTLKIVQVVGQYAQGDLSVDMDRLPGEKAMITDAIDKVKSQLLSVNEEIMVLVEAATQGRLGVRADDSRFNFRFKEMVKGLNEVMDAVVGPLNVAAKCIDDISKGAVPPKIAESFQGDYSLLINNLNTCIDAVNLLATDTRMLSSAASEGRLSIRADASRHEGDFRKIVQGVNDTLDAVIEPVNEASAVLEQVAARNMTVRMQGQYKGDLAKIKNALNAAVENLQVVLARAADSARLVAGASRQISAGSQSLAQGANEQASSLEEVSSNLEEMSSMTKQNAENAAQAKNLSGEAKRNAMEGSGAMENMAAAINKIKESSDQTAKIVKTIDEIAMQTNLLALNAAVEAARAGDSPWLRKRCAIWRSALRRRLKIPPT